MSVKSVPNIIKDGLILHFDFANPNCFNGNGSTIYNLVGDDNTGNINGGVSFVDKKNGCLKFNGSTGYVSLNMKNSYAETIIVWASSPTSIWSSTGWLSSSRRQNGHIIHPSGTYSHASFYVLNSSGTYYLIGTATPNDIRDVNMYCLTTNGSNSHKIYLNGEFVTESTTSITRTTTPTDQPYYFGKDDGFETADRFGDGNIHLLSRYNRELSASEILQNYNSVNNRYQSVLKYTTSDIVVNLDAGNSLSYPGSGTTWTDLSGYGNNAGLENSPTYSSSGGYFSFDGINDVAVISNSANLFLTTSFSVEMWVRVDTNGSAFMMLANKRNNSDLLSPFLLCIDNRGVGRVWNPDGTDDMVLLFGSSNGSSATYVWRKESFGITDGDNQWHHVVGTVNTDSNTIRLYYDGQLVMTETWTGSIVTNTSEIRIANEYTINSDNYPIDADIAVFRLYNKELSLKEIQKNFANLKDRYL